MTLGRRKPARGLAASLRRASCGWITHRFTRRGEELPSGAAQRSRSGEELLAAGCCGCKKPRKWIKSKKEWTKQQEKELLAGCRALGCDSWRWDGATSQALGAERAAVRSPWKGAGGRQYRQGTGTGRSLVWPKVASRPRVRRSPWQSRYAVFHTSLPRAGARSVHSFRGSCRGSWCLLTRCSQGGRQEARSPGLTSAVPQARPCPACPAAPPRSFLVRLLSFFRSSSGPTGWVPWWGGAAHSAFYPPTPPLGITVV